MKAILAALPVLILLSIPALAADSDPVGVDPANDGLFVTVKHETGPTAHIGSPTANTPSSPVPLLADVATDVRDAFCSGTNTTESCTPDVAAADPQAPAQVTPGIAAAAFQRVPLPAAGLHIQPVGGRTLINFPTNFYTRRDTLTRAVRLLGQRVELRIDPTTFTWHYGDGTTEATTDPGSPYPQLTHTHEYTTAEPVAPSLDTTYTAQYRLGRRGAWQPVPGTVTIPGPTTRLDVVEATPKLVSYQ